MAYKYFTQTKLKFRYYRYSCWHGFAIRTVIILLFFSLDRKEPKGQGLASRRPFNVLLRERKELATLKQLSFLIRSCAGKVSRHRSLCQIIKSLRDFSKRPCPASRKTREDGVKNFLYLSLEETI